MQYANIPRNTPAVIYSLYDGKDSAKEYAEYSAAITVKAAISGIHLSGFGFINAFIPCAREYISPAPPPKATQAIKTNIWFFVTHII